MLIKRLYDGQVIKNYKVLCIEYLDVIPTKGNGRIYHFRELSRFCEWHKGGQKIIIDKVFDAPKDKIDNRGKASGKDNNNWKYYEQLKISYEEKDNIGIYYILKDNDIYIGSTVAGFRERFQQHYYGYDPRMQHTYDMLQNGGEFHILYDMTGIEDEVLIRQVEDEYIQYFINNTDYNVINKKENAWSMTERIRPLTNKVIKVREDKYEQALQLLIDNGLIEDEEQIKTSNNYILNGMVNDFDTKDMPF